MGNIQNVTTVLHFGTLSYSLSGHGPLLFFLHGLGGGSGSWVYQLQELQDKFTVVAWDAPGYGKSDRCLPFLDSYVDAAQELIDTLGFDDVTVVGHSMGGLIAARIAAKKPACITRVILSSTFAGVSKKNGAPLGVGFQNRIYELETMSREEFGAVSARSMTSKNTDKAVFDLIARLAGSVNKEGYGDACRMLDQADNRDILTKVNIPVLIVEGEIDFIVSRNKRDILASLIPSAQRALITGVGHASYIEKPKVFNKVITKFITKTS